MIGMEERFDDERDVLSPWMREILSEDERSTTR